MARTTTAYVYLLASRRHGTLYTGVTSNLERRIYQHKHHLLQGFTSKYDVTRLVWYEQGEDIAAAINLEKKIKNRSRRWKIGLIEKCNPEWEDLAGDWTDSGSCDYAQDDRFSSTQDDRFSSAQDDRFSSAQDGRFSSTQDDRFSSAQDDRFSSTQDDRFSPTQNDVLGPVQDDK